MMSIASAPARCPFQEVRRKAGSLLIAQGEVPGCIYFLRRGTVLVSSTAPNGDEMLCALRTPACVLGLEALRGRPTDYEAWALSHVELCRLSADLLPGWIGEQQTAPMLLMIDLLLGESACRRQERALVSGRVLPRVARFLLERWRLNGGNVPLEAEQRVVARMLGMCPETLCRALRQLRAVGALAPGRAIMVSDMARLAEIAEEEE